MKRLRVPIDRHADGQRTECAAEACVRSAGPPPHAPKRSHARLTAADFPLPTRYPAVRSPGPVGDRMQFDQLKRRDVITLLGGAAVVWPIAARAQQTVRVLRVGFVGVQPRDAAIYVAFRKRMAELGYREDRYFTFEYIQTPSIDAYDASFRELAVAQA